MPRSNAPPGGPVGASPSPALRAKAARIHGVLDALHPETPIPLDHHDPFTLLIAVLLSAQTTDKKVNEVTPALFARGPTPAAMAQLDVDEIREMIREVGLAPTKARHVKAAAELLVSRHGGHVPPDLAALEALPGVGHKTASVVMSQAFGVPAFPVDTHIHRLATRWGLTSGRNVETTEADLKALYAPEHWNALHLQIIFFGRAHCPARGHDLSRCPICSFAASPERMAAEAAGLPPKKKRPAPAAEAAGLPPKKKGPAQAAPAEATTPAPPGAPRRPNRKPKPA